LPGFTLLIIIIKSFIRVKGHKNSINKSLLKAREDFKRLGVILKSVIKLDSAKSNPVNDYYDILNNP